MNFRRSNIEIIGDILRLEEAGKTEIMYTANMSYFQMKKYMDFLTERGFIEGVKLSNPRATYRVTEKGQRLLRSIDAMLLMLGLREED